jgi:hypothetical protein
MKTKTLGLDKLKSKDPKVKYGFTKELLNLGKDEPGLLYEYFDYWVEMLKSENNIFKWTAIDLIGYLSAVDRENKPDRQIENLLDLLHSGHLITSNHAIFALGLIAKNKPEHRARIIRELFTVSKDKFETEECKNIAIGKVVVTLGGFPDDIKDDGKILTFIKQSQHSTRNATKKKANALVKKLTNSR